jgi:hypothetical protein
MAFYALVVQQANADSLMSRTFSGGLWQFKAASCLFAFAGLAGLAMRAFGLVVQFGALERSALPEPPAEGQNVETASELLAELDAAPRSFDNTFLCLRLRRALELVRQRGSADELEHDLRLLAEEDRRVLADRYAGIRMLTAAVALVGVAGVAAGVTMSLGGASGKDWNSVLPHVMDGIGLACGGLVQAIGLTIVLLFARLAAQRAELGVLAAVDLATSRQLVGRFVTYGTPTDPHVASIQRMSEKLLATVQAVTERNDAAIGKTLGLASRRWEEMATTAGSMLHRTLGDALTSGLKEHANALSTGVDKFADELQGTLVRHAEILSENIDQHTAALADALEHHAAVMTEAENSLAAESRQRLSDMEAGLGEAMLLNATRQEKLIRQSEDMLKEMQVALVEAAGATVAQQEQLIKQSDVLLKVVEATNQVRKLEEALNGNLASLNASHDFEQTVTSLAAAVQLLSVRLRHPAIVRNEIDLTGDDTTSQAA